MSSAPRKWLALLCAVLLYYLAHEGAHLLVALVLGVFETIRVTGWGLGVQIVADTAAMSPFQIFVFCIAGALATLIIGYILVWRRKKLAAVKSPLFRAVAYYTTVVFLFLDPLYLSVLHHFTGGGDMNGIAGPGVPTLPVSLGFLALGLVNGWIFIRKVNPEYRKSFAQSPG